jgi:hypothetical protein
MSMPYQMNSLLVDTPRNSAPVVPVPTPAPTPASRQVPAVQSDTSSKSSGLFDSFPLNLINKDRVNFDNNRIKMNYDFTPNLVFPSPRESVRDTDYCKCGTSGGGCGATGLRLGPMERDPLDSFEHFRPNINSLRIDTSLINNELNDEATPRCFETKFDTSFETSFDFDNDEPPELEDFTSEALNEDSKQRYRSLITPALRCAQPDVSVTSNPMSATFTELVDKIVDDVHVACTTELNKMINLMDNETIIKDIIHTNPGFVTPEDELYMQDYLKKFQPGELDKLLDDSVKEYRKNVIGTNSDSDTESDDDSESNDNSESDDDSESDCDCSDCTNDVCDHNTNDNIDNCVKNLVDAANNVYNTTNQYNTRNDYYQTVPQQEIVKQPSDDVKQANTNHVSENPIYYDQYGYVQTDISVSGKKFNEIYEGVSLVKLTNESCCHNGITFTEGEIEDINPFRYDQVCGPDGIYFCTEENMHRWLDYSVSPMVYVWDVIIPNNAKTLSYSLKMKADRLILLNKRKISDYYYDKLMQMCNDRNNINKVFELLETLPASACPDERSIENIYISLLMHDVELFSRIPAQHITYNLCMYVAQQDMNAYVKIKNFFLSHDILIELIKKNPLVYKQLEPSLVSQDFSDYLFETNPALYNILCDDHKTLDMTLRYVAVIDDNKFVADSIPARYMNQIAVLNRVIPNDGKRLADVDFRLKNYDICLTAVQNNGLAIESVPYVLLDQKICLEAVKKSGHAVYKYVPVLFRTVEVKEAMVMHSVDSIYKLPIGDLTLNMILCMLSDSIKRESFLLAYIGKKEFDQLLIANLKQCIDMWNGLYHCIPVYYYTNMLAWYQIELAPGSYSKFCELPIQFHIECVKRNLIPFKKIARLYEVTPEMMIELVTDNSQLINSIPKRFMSDDLYIVMMQLHGMRLSDVPEEYRTTKLAKIGMELNPCEGDLTFQG